MAGIVQIPDPATTGAVVPSADSTANTYERDVVGNKTDAAVTTVGTTKSLTGYSKGVLSVVAPGNVTVVTNSLNSGISGAYSAWQEEIASLSSGAVRIEVTGGMLTNNTTTIDDTTFDLGIGAGGAEAAISSCRTRCTAQATAASGVQSFSLSCDRFIASGTRVAVRAKNSTANIMAYSYSINVTRL